VGPEGAEEVYVGELGVELRGGRRWGGSVGVRGSRRRSSGRIEQKEHHEVAATRLVVARGRPREPVGGAARWVGVSKDVPPTAATEIFGWFHSCLRIFGTKKTRVAGIIARGAAGASPGGSFDGRSPGGRALGDRPSVCRSLLASALFSPSEEKAASPGCSARRVPQSARRQRAPQGRPTSSLPPSFLTSPQPIAR